jgi:ribosomal-protein-alanine N-acetyltransferase
MSEITIRPMTRDDLPRVLAIERASFDKPWTSDLFLGELMREKISRNFVAVMYTPPDHPGPGPGSTDDLEPTVRGFIMAWQVVDEIHINNVAIDPAVRRQGVASRLIEFLLEQGREYGAVYCSLEVRVSNARAISVYERLGFTAAGIRKGYYSDGEDAIVLNLRMEEA